MLSVQNEKDPPTPPPTPDVCHLSSALGVTTGETGPDGGYEVTPRRGRAMYRGGGRGQAVLPRGWRRPPRGMGTGRGWGWMGPALGGGDGGRKGERERRKGGQGEGRRKKLGEEEEGAGRRMD